MLTLCTPGGSNVHYWSSRETRGASQCARPASLALFPPSPQCVKRALRAYRNARLLDFWPTNQWSPPPISLRTWARMRLHPPAARAHEYYKTKKQVAVRTNRTATPGAGPGAAQLQSTPRSRTQCHCIIIIYQI